ncbi:MAG: tRNA lysidine(34) synthetase TilS [bacterium]
MILKKVKATINKYSMFSPGDRVLVATSGGPDSVSLLHILLSLREELEISLLVIAHVEHGLRGEESAADAGFVADLAQSLGIPYVEKKLDLKGSDRIKGLSLQTAARKLRYRFFFEQKECRGADKIALAHTASDQEETVLMRFLTGSGSRGLAGIPPVRNDGVVRPLIEITKPEIIEYLKDKQISFRVDQSNSQTAYLRNRLRIELIPHLRTDYQPALTKRLTSLANILREEDFFLNEQVENCWRELEIQTGFREKKLVIPLLIFNAWHPAIKRRIIRKAIFLIKGDLVNIEYVHVEKILSLCQSAYGERAVSLPAGLYIAISYQNLIISRRGGREDKTDPLTLEIPGKAALPGLGLEITAAAVSPSQVQYGNPMTAYFDRDKIGNLPLRIRFRETGDRFQPLGFGNCKLLSRCLIDWKAPRGKRDRIPLVASSKGILWVSGYRNCDWAKVTERTQHIIRLELLKI